MTAHVNRFSVVVVGVSSATIVLCCIANTCRENLLCSRILGPKKNNTCTKLSMRNSHIGVRVLLVTYERNWNEESRDAREKGACPVVP